MYTFHGLTATGAARRLDRILSVQDMTGAATETRTEPNNFFTVPQNDEIKGAALAGSSKAVAVPIAAIPQQWDPGRSPGQVDTGTLNQWYAEREQYDRITPGSPPPAKQETPTPSANSPSSATTPQQSSTATPQPATSTPAANQPAPQPQPATSTPSTAAPGSADTASPSNPVVAMIVGGGTSVNPAPEGSLPWLLTQTQQQPKPAPAQQPASLAESSSPPARVDPALLQSFPVLQTTYNADGTIKLPEQRNSENATRDVLNQVPGVEDPAQSNPAQRVVDTVTSGVRPPGVVGPQELVDLTTALGHGEDGTTPLAGGGELIKTITNTDTGWQTGYDVTLSNGQHLSWTNSGVQANWQLPNGNTVIKTPLDEARKTTYEDITRAYAAARATGRDLATDPAITAAQRTSTMLSALGGRPGDLVGVIKDRDGNIVQVSITDRNGVEHVVTALTDEFAPGLQFDFYRHPDGTVTDRNGNPLVMVNGSQLHLNTDHTVTIPPNPAAKDVRIQQRKPGSDSASQYWELPDSPARGTNAPRLYVRRPDTGIWAEIAEIPLPPGLTAHRLYKVAGGGVLVEDTSGTHWATDPGKALTVSDELKSTAIDLAFLAGGELVGSIAARGATALGRHVLSRYVGRGTTRATGPATGTSDTVAGQGPRGLPEPAENVPSPQMPTTETVTRTAEPISGPSTAETEVIVEARQPTITGGRQGESGPHESPGTNNLPNSHATPSKPGAQDPTARTSTGQSKSPLTPEETPVGDTTGPKPASPPSLDAVRHTDVSRQHILGGDVRNSSTGGHRPGTGFSGKTEFPKHWTDEDIIDAAYQVTQKGEMTKGPFITKDALGNRRVAFSYEGKIDEVTVRTTVFADGEIRTSFPLKSTDPGVISNPSLPADIPSKVKKSIPQSHAPRYSNPELGGDGSWTWRGKKGGRDTEIVLYPDQTWTRAVREPDGTWNRTVHGPDQE
ncbi:EndoU domain-containing protein [Nocardia sp. NPDC003482]